MLTKQTVDQAIRVQQIVYAFIDWLRDARFKTGLRFDHDHKHIPECEAAADWLVNNRGVIPEELLPHDADMVAYTSMLVSFGHTSADHPLRQTPVDIHCSCRFCNRLIWRLGEKVYPRKRDRDMARVLKLMTLRDLVASNGWPLVEADLEQIVTWTGNFGRDLARVSYGAELVRRCRFSENRHRYKFPGVGLVILWREVAYDEHGHIPRDFRLHADHVLASQRRVVDTINTYIARRFA